MAQAASSTSSDSTVEEVSARSVQILKPANTRGVYELDTKALEVILLQDSVINKPVAVYSIAGDFRTGKSFILNLFLHYFWVQETKFDPTKETTWFDVKPKKWITGFGWRGGREVCTEGVWLWDKPFFVTNKQGEEVAIFLLDTQGSFDHKQTIEECSMVFAFSTLISSCQIFNVMRNIQENHLQQLQLFTQYGESVHENDGEGSSAFQTLLFLVRDYHNPSYDGFRGGRKVIEDILRVRQTKGELTNVRKHIHKSFENVDCCLLSYPGECVVKGKTSFPAQLVEIESGFLENVDELIQHIFNTNIVLKKFNGNKVTGGILLDIITKYFQHLQNRKMPQIKTITQANSELMLEEEVIAHVKQYDQEMEKKCSSGIIPSKDLNQFHLNLKSEILAKFDRRPKFGEVEYSKKCFTNLSKWIDDRYLHFKYKNIVLEGKIKKEISDLEASAEAIMHETLFEEGESYVDEQSLERLKGYSKRQTLNFFHENTENYDQQLVKEYKAMLDEAITSMLLERDAINKMRKANIEATLFEVSAMVKSSYQNEMEEKTNSKFVEQTTFMKIHTEALQSAFELFDICTGYAITNFATTARDQLQRDLELYFTKYKETNEFYKKLDSNEKEILTQAKSLYRETMNVTCTGKFITTKHLTEAHDNATNSAKALVEILLPQNGRQFVVDCTDRLVHILNSDFEQLKEKNENLKTIVTKEMEDKATQAIGEYKANAKKFKREYINEQILDKKLNNFGEEALKFYCNNVAIEPNRAYLEYRKYVVRETSRLREAAIQTNEKNKEKEEEKVQNLCDDLVSEYINSFEQHFKSRRSNRSEEMECFHENLKTEALQKFSAHGENFPDQRQQLINKLDDLGYHKRDKPCVVM